MVGESFFQGLATEVGFHGDRHSMAEKPAAEPIDYGGKIDETMCHRDVLPASCAAIRVDFVSRRRFARVRFAINRFDDIRLHQRGDVLTTDFDAFGIQEISVRLPANGNSMPLDW